MTQLIILIICLALILLTISFKEITFEGFFFGLVLGFILVKFITYCISRWENKCDKKAKKEFDELEFSAMCEKYGRKK